ncbi:MAG: carbohydrate-binding domain-containing protein [Coriobacteriales bacterium]|jgi:hypothetical protein|nr:carbohydrate-binding domain-containing protein [Coriobacteriales bacterium]
MKKLLSLLLTLLLAGILTLSVALAGCGSIGSNGRAETAPAGESGMAATASEATEAQTLDSFDFSLTDRDSDALYDEEAATIISFDSANQVETITQEGVYIARGSSEGGQLIVDLSNAEDPDNAKAQVVLDNLTLTNTTAPALLVAQADKVFITLAEGSTNTLSDGTGRTDLEALTTTAADASSTESEEAAESEEANENATLYSHDDLSINGSGSLVVSSANHHAIKCQDDLVIADGSLKVTAGGDGIRGKDSVKIAGGTITVEAGDDGIISTQTDAPYEQGFISITGGQITVAATDDGLKGEALVRLAGGSVSIEDSTEGLEACLVWLEGGLHTITSSDDGINAAGDIRSDYLINITGGTTYVNAEGDGLDSNDTLTQSGGTVVVAGPAQTFGEGALDAERLAQITGGTMLAVDNAGMSMGYGSESTQGSLLYTLSGVESAGTRISLLDSADAVLFTFVAPKEFSTLAYSSPELTVGESYRFVRGGEVASSTSSGFEFLTGGTLSGGETLTSFTLSEQIAQIRADGSVSAYTGSGMMGPGGGGAGGGGPGGNRSRGTADSGWASNRGTQLPRPE